MFIYQALSRKAMLKAEILSKLENAIKHGYWDEKTIFDNLSNNYDYTAPEI